VGAVVQARMGSARLPRKMLMPLAGKPALEWLLERLEHAESLDLVMVATSAEPDDDQLADFCARRGTLCHRGDLDDVAGRMLGAARDASLDAFARVNGDSPLLDQRLVDRGVELMRASDADLVTNVRPRTFPPGQSVEVVRTEALERALAADPPAEEREHVTGPLYGGEFRILRFENDPPQTEVRFTLDTPEDAKRLAAILAGMDRPHWEYTWEDHL
jgi:spore coat polysaccharide biosynthesis protein SpsF